MEEESPSVDAEVLAPPPHHDDAPEEDEECPIRSTDITSPSPPTMEEEEYATGTSQTMDVGEREEAGDGGEEAAMPSKFNDDELITADDVVEAGDIGTSSTPTSVEVNNRSDGSDEGEDQLDFPPHSSAHLATTNTAPAPRKVLVTRAHLLQETLRILLPLSKKKGDNDNEEDMAVKMGGALTTSPLGVESQLPLCSFWTRSAVAASMLWEIFTQLLKLQWGCAAVASDVARTTTTTTTPPAPSAFPSSSEHLHEFHIDDVSNCPIVSSAIAVWSLQLATAAVTSACSGSPEEGAHSLAAALQQVADHHRREHREGDDDDGTAGPTDHPDDVAARSNEEDQQREGALNNDGDGVDVLPLAVTYSVWAGCVCRILQLGAARYPLAELPPLPAQQLLLGRTCRLLRTIMDVAQLAAYPESISSSGGDAEDTAVEKGTGDMMEDPTLEGGGVPSTSAISPHHQRSEVVDADTARHNLERLTAAQYRTIGMLREVVPPPVPPPPPPLPAATAGSGGSHHPSQQLRETGLRALELHDLPSSTDFNIFCETLTQYVTTATASGEAATGGEKSEGPTRGDSSAKMDDQVLHVTGSPLDDWWMDVETVLATVSDAQNPSQHLLDLVAHHNIPLSETVFALPRAGRSVSRSTEVLKKAPNMADVSVKIKRVVNDDIAMSGDSNALLHHLRRASGESRTGRNWRSLLYPAAHHLFSDVILHETDEVATNQRLNMELTKLRNEMLMLMVCAGRVADLYPSSSPATQEDGVLAHDDELRSPTAVLPPLEAVQSAVSVTPLPIPTSPLHAGSLKKKKPTAAPGGKSKTAGEKGSGGTPVGDLAKQVYEQQQRAAALHSSAVALSRDSLPEVRRILLRPPTREEVQLEISPARSHHGAMSLVPGKNSPSRVSGHQQSPPSPSHQPPSSQLPAMSRWTSHTEPHRVTRHREAMRSCKRVSTPQPKPQQTLPKRHSMGPSIIPGLAPEPTAESNAAPPPHHQPSDGGRPNTSMTVMAEQPMFNPEFRASTPFQMLVSDQMHHPPRRQLPSLTPPPTVLKQAREGLVRRPSGVTHDRHVAAVLKGEEERVLLGIDPLAGPTFTMMKKSPPSGTSIRASTPVALKSDVANTAFELIRKNGKLRRRYFTSEAFCAEREEHEQHLLRMHTQQQRGLPFQQQQQQKDHTMASLKGLLEEQQRRRPPGAGGFLGSRQGRR